MPTQFEAVFDEFLMREIDSAKILSYGIDLRFKLLSSLLFGARGMFRDEIFSNSGEVLNKCEDVVEFSRTTYNYSTSDPTFTVTLDPAPEDGSSLYIEVNDVETRNFTYDNSTNEVIIMGLGAQSSISVGAYKNGQFNQQLTLTEFELFVRIMGLVYLRDKIRADRVLCQVPYGRDWGLHSQASHLSQLQKTYKEDQDLIYKDIMLYTYRNDPNRLQNLGGESSV